MMRPLLSLMSPAGARARLSILIFHRVVPVVDPLFPDEIDAQTFDRLCGWLAADYQVLPLEQAVLALQQGRLPSRALSITFDDGYADNHGVALPILLRHGLQATFFVATGFLDGGRMWNDTLVESLRRTPRAVLDLEELGLPGIQSIQVASVDQKRAAVRNLLGSVKYLRSDVRQVAVERLAAISGAQLPDDLMMTSAEVMALHRAGMTVGAHTVSHPILASLPAEQARREIVGGKAMLESLIQAPVRLFAYPNGRPDTDYSDESVALARSVGFTAAVSTFWGAASAGSDVHQLPRFTPWDRERVKFNARLIANLLR